MTIKKPDPTPLLSADMIRDLRIRLDALLTRGCAHANRHDPVTIHDMLDLYELSARVELLIETLDAQRRMHGDVYGGERALKEAPDQE